VQEILQYHKGAPMETIKETPMEPTPLDPLEKEEHEKEES